MRLKQLDEVKASIPQVKSVMVGDEEVAIQVKPVCLLMAYMLDNVDDYFDSEEAEFQKDLEKILRAIPSYLDILIMITIALANQFKTGQTKKRLTCRNILALIQFS